MDFSTHLAHLDSAIDAHLRDTAWLRPAAGGADQAIRVAIEHPLETETLTSAGIVRARPWVEMSLLTVSSLKKGDQVLVGVAAPFQGWRIAATPTRPGDGRHWRAEVEPMGVVSA